MRRGRSCRSFFYQAEDGIRDLTVPGVQTCALPICSRTGSSGFDRRARLARQYAPATKTAPPTTLPSVTQARLYAAPPRVTAGGCFRSGEGRGGEEWRTWWVPDHLKKKTDCQCRIMQ